MKKEIIIILVILAIGLIIFIPKSCNKPINIKQDDGWKILKKEREKEIEVKDSIYLDLKHLANALMPMPPMPTK